MKKNNMLRLASVLLVAVLLSTCAISGVFAKYYRTNNDSDVAQVAKWGLKIDANATNNTIFAKAYDNSVEAAGDYNLVAPGTDSEAEWTPFVVTGAPEVDFNLSFVSTVTLAGNWEDENGDFYCPITVKVNGTPVDFSAATTKDAWQTALKGAIDGLSEDYEANNTADIVVPTVTWAWAFEDGKDDADTQLGDIAAGLVDGKTLPKITIAIVATATQID